jgi:hypothetical protein
MAEARGVDGKVKVPPELRGVAGMAYDVIFLFTAAEFLQAIGWTFG